jgi:hypothetical protein
MEHKMAAYRFLLHRKPSLPLFPSRQQNERNTIQQIVRANGFAISPIQSINSRIEHALQHPNSTDFTPQTKIWTTFTYHGALIRTVSNSLKHTKLHMTFRTTNTIFNLLIPKSYRNNEDNANSDIYSLWCSTFQASYVGQTGRGLKQRCLEHTRHLNKITHNLHMP